VPEWTDRFPRAIATRSLDELLAAERLDAVVIAGPLPDRASRIAAALAAGKHVLVDGAMSATADDAFDLASHARTYGRCLMAESGLLFDPGLRKLKELVATGQLGVLYRRWRTVPRRAADPEAAECERAAGRLTRGLM
jgi:predicted dehydrogenase